MGVTVRLPTGDELPAIRVIAKLKFVMRLTRAWLGGARPVRLSFTWTWTAGQRRDAFGDDPVNSQEHVSERSTLFQLLV